MQNPFKIDGPALVSFSGGRTSGYMLRRILDAGLEPDVHIVFANTGKERPETLNFVQACSDNWNCEINWVEYCPGGWRQVDHESAARDGSPFKALIDKRQFLPNPVTRFCTQELKIRVMKAFMLKAGYKHWDNIVGIRADEPKRIEKMRRPNKERWENELPLADAGTVLADVTAFWQAQSFDLQLRSHEGNCDLCFLKGRDKKLAIIRDRPDLSKWWIQQEISIGGASEHTQWIMQPC